MWRKPVTIRIAAAVPPCSEQTLTHPRGARGRTLMPRRVQPARRSVRKLSLMQKGECQL